MTQESEFDGHVCKIHWLQVLQQLEARKAELMKSSKAAEGAVLEGGAQVDAGAGGGSQECGENGKAEQKQVQQHADKRKRCHSADGAKLEDAVGRTKVLRFKKYLSSSTVCATNTWQPQNSQHVW